MNYPYRKDAKGMSTLTSKATDQVRATAVWFEGDVLQVSLSDRRQISLPVTEIGWLAWLAKATPAQRAKWSIEPGGFGIYWDDLDDGIEVGHLLDIKPLG